MIKACKSVLKKLKTAKSWIVFVLLLGVLPMIGCASLNTPQSNSARIEVPLPQPLRLEKMEALPQVGDNQICVPLSEYEKGAKNLSEINRYIDQLQAYTETQ